MIFNAKDYDEIVNALESNYDELEIRFKLTDYQIINIFNNLKDQKYQIIDSIMLLGPNGYRKESFYVNGTKKNSDIIKKTVLHKFKYPEFTLAISTEKEDFFDIILATEIRVKKRLRFMTNTNTTSTTSTTSEAGSRAGSNSKGYIDFTYVENFSPKEAELLQKSLKIFNTPIEKLLDKTGWELELEINGKVTIDDISIMINNILLLVGINLILLNTLKDICIKLNKIMERPSLKRITNNPMVLDRLSFLNISVENYVILEKTDGKRALVKLYDKDNYSIIQEGTVKTIGTTNINYHLFDAEIINNDIYIFDIILHDSKLVQMNYIQRMNLVKSITFSNNTYTFLIKEYFPLSCEELKKIIEGKHALEIDGIIFNEINALYTKMKIYKWKPPSLITFDFLVVPFEDKFILTCGCLKEKCKNSIFPKFNVILGEFGIKNSEYMPVPFSPSSWPMAYLYLPSTTNTASEASGSSLWVGEFQFNNKNGKMYWKLLKVRDDKTELIKNGIYGNDYATIEQQFNELQNPLTVEDVCNEYSIASKNVQIKNYFQYDKGFNYKNLAKFNNFVKFKMLSFLKCSKIQTVLDIGSGKGQDVYMYNGLKVPKVIFTEPDKDAYKKLCDRLENLKDKKSYVHTIMPDVNMTYMTYNYDYQTLINYDYLQSFQAVVCNLALHYFLKNKSDYDEFAKFCKNCHMVVITCIDYDVLKNKLPYKNDKYDVYEKDGMLYFKHHFSDTHIAEHIINNKEFISSMKKYFDLILHDSFGRYLVFNKNLSSIDAEYSSFYQYFIFRKK